MNTKPFLDYLNYKRSEEYECNKRKDKELDIKKRKAFANRLGLDFNNDITPLSTVRIIK